MNKEIKKAEEAMAKEKNLNQISFYEGYIKGLKFAKQEIIEEVEGMKELCPPSDGDPAGCLFCRNKPHNILIDKIINLIKKQ